MEIVEIRDPVGNDRVTRASNHVLGVMLKILGKHGIIVVGKGTSKDRGARPTDFLSCDAS